MAPTTTSKPNLEELESKVEEAANEVETLEQQLNDARSQIARAQARFAELDQQRKVLAPRTFQGDEKAKLELEALEDTYDEVSRSMRLGEAAEPELAAELAESKGRLARAREQVQRARASESYEKLKAVEERRDELAAELAEVLEEHSSAYGEYAGLVQHYSVDEANALATGRIDMYQQWFKQRFAEWI